MRLLATLSIVFALTGQAHANADESFWEKNHCTRSLPEPVLIKKSVNGHTFKVIKKRGEALETATVAGEKITIIHFGCEGVGLQIRTQIKPQSAEGSTSLVYERARKLLRTIEPAINAETHLTDVIRTIDNYAAPPKLNPPLAERLVVAPGNIQTSVSVDATSEGADTWLTVMIYTGPL